MNTIKTTIILLGLFIGTQLSSQIDFADVLYTKIALENIELLDSLGKSLNLNSSITELFYWKDTSMNCWGDPKEKFINLEYWPFGISESKVHTKMDTSMSSYQNDLINFYSISYNQYYELSDKVYLFSANRQALYPIDKLTKSIRIDEQVVNVNNCFWVLESIKLDNKTFQLDSCHLNYKLAIAIDGKYSQYYGNGLKNCDCLLTQSIIKEESYDLSLNERIFHKLLMASGEIRTYENKLVISNEGRDNVIEFDYETEDGKLVLKTSNNYFITLKTNPACNSR